MNDFVSSLFNKLSAYNLLSLMLPGASSLGIMKFLFAIDIKVDENIWWFLLASYVVGIVISRMGSLLIEELIKKLGIIEDYQVSDYILRRKEDDFVETLLSFANLYRSFCILSICFLIITLIKGYNFCTYWHYYTLELCLGILFGCSFCKQYRYFIESISNPPKEMRKSYTEEGTLRGEAFKVQGGTMIK